MSITAVGLVSLIVIANHTPRSQNFKNQINVGAGRNRNSSIQVIPHNIHLLPRLTSHPCLRRLSPGLVGLKWSTMTNLRPNLVGYPSGGTGMVLIRLATMLWMRWLFRTRVGAGARSGMAFSRGYVQRNYVCRNNLAHRVLLPFPG